MTKKANTTAAIEFNEGDRVIVSCNRTFDEEVYGTIIATLKGWYKVELDEIFDDGEGKPFKEVSVRASSLQVLADEESDEDEELESPDEEGLDDEEEENTDAHKMAKALREARTRYTKALRPDGTPTAHSNDLIARVLLDSEPLEVCSFADSICEEPQGYHAERYASLNNGQKRMNAGNKIRSHWRKAVELNDTTTMQLIMGVLGLDEDDLEQDDAAPYAGDDESSDSDFEGNHN